jgi:hypothetical protein
MPETPISIAVPLSRPEDSETPRHLPHNRDTAETFTETVDLRTLARLVLARDTCRDAKRDDRPLKDETPAKTAAFLITQKNLANKGNAPVPLSRIPVSETAETPGRGFLHGEGSLAAIVEPPLRLQDGRRLHRFLAESVPTLVPGHVRILLDQARGYGAVLVADGRELIVVERWRCAMSPEELRALHDSAGEIIAVLRGESRARCGMPTGSEAPT